MKIYTGVRDAKRMELAELEAINRSVTTVQATTDEREEISVEQTEEAKKPRKKKKEADV